MESVLSTETVSFEALFRRLISAVNLRIKNGEYTERGLARILEISQPQMHNVLKGARKMHVDLADRLLSKLDLSVTQLFEADELSEELCARLSASGLPAFKKPVQQELHLRAHDAHNLRKI